MGSLIWLFIKTGSFLTVCLWEKGHILNKSIQALKATTDFADYTDFFVSSVLGSRGTLRRKWQKQIYTLMKMGIDQT